MISADDLLAGFKPLRSSCRILLDGDLYEELGRLSARLKEAQRAEMAGGIDTSDLASPSHQIRHEYAEKAALAEDKKREFTFQAIPRQLMDDIRRRYPPSEERWERYRQEAKGNMFAQVPQWDTDAAAPEMMSHSLVAIDGQDVDWGIKDAEKLWNALGDGQATELFNAMWAVQEDTAAAPLSVSGIGAIDGSGESSITQPGTESPSPSS